MEPVVLGKANSSLHNLGFFKYARCNPLRNAKQTAHAQVCKKGRVGAVPVVAVASVSAPPRVGDDGDLERCHEKGLLEEFGAPTVFGRVHSTESFTAVDGPGIRFMVFLQGCCCRCKFCCNPDTWSYCAGQLRSSKDIADQMKKTLPFMTASGGGVTCSGGEALMQPDFVAAIFQEAHNMGVNTCLDTNGQATKRHWDEVLPHTDRVLVCVKHMDPEKYRKLVGAPMFNMLRFVAELNRRKIPFVVRYVLIPGHTMDGDDISALIDFCKEQESIEAVELLPYHLLGLNKWRELGIEYPLEGVEPPTRSEVLKVVKRMETAGLNVICDITTANDHH